MRNIQFSCLRIIRVTQTHHLERVVMIGGGREERKGHNGINIFIIMLGGQLGTPNTILHYNYILQCSVWLKSDD